MSRTKSNPATRIAIIGKGTVGGALCAWFEREGADVQCYDPARGFDDRAVIDRADIVFVCVPTPHVTGAGFDESALLTAIEAISGAKLVVIKSTVPPGTTDALQREYPQHRFIFNPEFLREATAYDDLLHPERQIAGCTPQSAADAERLLRMLPPAPFVRICPAREAEMAKYAANAFLATKVSFANEVFDVCARLGVDYDSVRDIVAADPRIGPSHLDVLDGGYRGYGGKCLPKDTRGLIDIGERAGLEMRLLRATEAVNARVLAASPRRRPPVEAPDADEAGLAQRERPAA